MKQNLIAFFVLSLVVAFNAGARTIVPENGPKNEIFEKNGKYGLRDKESGRVSLVAVYDTIKGSYFSCDALNRQCLTVENCFEVYKDGKAGIFSDALGKIILQPGPYKSFERVFGWAHPCNQLPCVKVVPETGKEWFLTDCGVRFNEGELCTMIVEDVSYTYDPYNAHFTPKLYKGFIIEKNGKLGYMNKNGKTLILPKYDEWVAWKSREGLEPNYDRLVFRNFNKAGTGFTVYAYTIDGTLLASKFFYKDQEYAYSKFLQRYM